MIYTVSQNKTKWCAFSPVDTRMYDADEVHAFFIDILEDNGKDKYVFIRNLDNYYMDILRVVKYLGYIDITADNLPAKKMPQGTFTYLVSNDGRCFNISVKNAESRIEFRNFEMLVPIKKDRELLETYPQNYLESIEAVARAMFEAIVDIGGIVKSDKVPLTLSSLAYKMWEQSYNPADFYTMFQNADNISVHDTTLEKYCRAAYFGEWCYLNYNKERRYKDHRGCTLDVNSLYSYVMENCPLPFGKPFTFKKEIPDVVQRLSKEGYIYYYIRVKCYFTLKEGHFPCIQIADTFVYRRDWLETTNIYQGEVKPPKPTLTLTMTDYQLLLEHYDVSELEIIDGVYFRSAKKIFHGFIDKFYKMKSRARTKGGRKVAKMTLNSLSGNMAKKRERMNMIIDPTKPTEEAFIDVMKVPVKGISHIHIGAAITAYARQYIIGWAHKYSEHFCYSDTDSLHLDCDFRELDIPISAKMGDFKVECEWTEAIFFTKKIYVERFTVGYKIKDATFRCSGLDGEINEMITEMLLGRHPQKPEGMDDDTFITLRVRLIENGVEALESMRIPYTEKTYGDFTYETHFNDFKLNIEQKLPKTVKIL